MRNLKRALSLTLASVMLLGMMVVGTSALSFNDADDISNVTAASVLEDLGIMQGDGSGNFMPDKAVTRAQMAIIVCRILYGNKLNVSQFEGTTQYTDVGANDYYTGYINLATQLGIIGGYGDGRFGPNDTVTTAQAALMLSRALGYFKGSEIAQATDWALASIAQATKINMFGNLNLPTNAELARDNVAEMVFNTISKAVPVQYNELLGVYYNENQGIIYSLEFNYLQTLGYKNFSLVYDSDTQDMYGRPATTWGTGSYNANNNATSSGTVNKTNNLTDRGGLIASNVRMKEIDEIITVPNTPTYVYTANTKEKDVYNDLGRTVVSGRTGNNNNNYLYNWVWYIDGREQTTSNGGVRVKPTAGSDNRYVYTSKGTQTEIYVDDYDFKVTVVEINYYIGEVSSVKEDKDGRYITIKELSDGSNLDVRTFYTADFAEEDYVIYTVDYVDNDRDYVIGEVFEPDVISGEVARVEKDATDNSTYLRFEKGGTKYPYSFYYEGSTKNGEDHQSHMIFDVDADVVPTAEHPALNTEYDLLRDPNGYVVAFRETNKQPDKYLYVQDSDEELRKWSADAVLEDATNPVVKVDTDLDVPAQVDIGAGDAWSTTNDPVPTYYGDTIKWVDYDIHGREKDSNIDFRIWKYTVGSSDTYGLDFVETYFMGDGNDGHAANTARIHNGRAYTDWNDDTSATGFIVDEDTIFVDVDGGKAYIGYKEVPSVADAKLAYALGGKGGRVAKVVFILEGEIYDENTIYFMLSSDSHETLKYKVDGDNYRVYDDAYVNGEKTSLTIRYNALAGRPTGPEEGKLYKVLQTKDEEYITKIELVTLTKDVPVEVAKNAFWVDSTDSKTMKYDVDDETVYVLSEYLPKNASLWKNSGYNAVAYDNAGGEWEWKISRGRLGDMKITQDDQNFFTYVTVVKKANSDQTAKLVYIIRTQEWPAKKGVTVTGGDAAFNSSLLGANNEPLMGQEFLPGANVSAKIPADQLEGKKVTGITVNGTAVPADKIVTNADGSVSFQFAMPDAASVEVNVTTAETTIDTIEAANAGTAEDIKAGAAAPAVPTLTEAGFTVTTAGAWSGAAYDGGDIKAEGGALTLTYKVEADEDFQFAPKSEMTLPTLFGAEGKWSGSDASGNYTISYSYTVEKKAAFKSVVPKFMLDGQDVTDTIAADVKGQVKADFDGGGKLKIDWVLPENYELQASKLIGVDYVEGSRKVTVTMDAATAVTSTTTSSTAAEDALKAKAADTVLNVTITLAGKAARTIDWKVAADAGVTCYIAAGDDTVDTGSVGTAVKFTLTDLPEYVAEAKVTYTVTGATLAAPLTATTVDVTDGVTDELTALTTSDTVNAAIGEKVVVTVTKVEVTKVNYKVEFAAGLDYKLVADELSTGVALTPAATIPKFKIQGDKHTVAEGAKAIITYTVSGVTGTENLTVTGAAAVGADSNGQYEVAASTATFTPAGTDFVTITVEKVEITTVKAKFVADAIETDKAKVASMTDGTTTLANANAGTAATFVMQDDKSLKLILKIGDATNGTSAPADGVYTVTVNGVEYTAEAKTATGLVDLVIEIPADKVSDAEYNFTVTWKELPTTGG